VKKVSKFHPILGKSFGRALKVATSKAL
jgi:hypothetical protein